MLDRASTGISILISATDNCEHVPAIYPCFIDPDDLTQAVIAFDPVKTRYLLLLFTLIPAVVFIVSCSYICFCNKMVYVADDGRMRLK